MSTNLEPDPPAELVSPPDARVSLVAEQLVGQVGRCLPGKADTFTQHTDGRLTESWMVHRTQSLAAQHEVKEAEMEELTRRGDAGMSRRHFVTGIGALAIVVVAGGHRPAIASPVSAAVPSVGLLGATRTGDGDLWLLTTRSSALEAVVSSESSGMRLRPPEDFVAAGLTAIDGDLAVFGAQLLELSLRTATTGDYGSDSLAQPRLAGEPVPPGEGQTSGDENREFEVRFVTARPAVAVRQERGWEVTQVGRADDEPAILAAAISTTSGVDFIAEMLLADDAVEPIRCGLYALRGNSLAMRPHAEVDAIRMHHQRVVLSAANEQGTYLLVAGPQSARVVRVSPEMHVQQLGRPLSGEELDGSVVGYRPVNGGIELVVDAPDGRKMYDLRESGSFSVSRYSGTAALELQPDIVLEQIRS